MHMYKILNTLAEIRCQATGSVNGSSFAITLNCTVNGEFECSLDGGSFQSCMQLVICSNVFLFCIHL